MRVVFIGTGEIGVPTLRVLLESSAHQVIGVVTQPDKPAGRDQQIRPPSIKAALAGSAMPFFQPARIRSEEAVVHLRSWAPEVIVVMAYGQILPRAVLEIPSRACLNLHASLLPRHRGAAPVQAALVAGDRETGITVIYMDEGLDTGDILLKKMLPILPDETGGSLHDRLASLAPAALLEALDLLERGTAPRLRQDASRATYAPKLNRDQGRINWNEPAELIERKIRAYDPWPGAFTCLRDPTGAGLARKLKLFRATAVAQVAGPPGAVFTPNESQLLIATARGALRLEEVQLEGKRRMQAAEFLRGFSSPRLDF